ncbi:MAG: hypothetical protein V2A65_00235 [Candidatus Omnitrophota bacterium]
MRGIIGKAGFALTEILVVASLVTAVPVITYQAVKRGKGSVCLNNLKQISLVLEMFSGDNNGLPNARFFPSSLDDPYGIHNILKSYNITPQLLHCPCIPDQLNKYGTNYIWNDTLNGKNKDTVDSSTWIMTEMTAVSKDVPPPHENGFAVLYADGHAAIGPKVQFPEVKPSSPEGETSPPPEDEMPFSNTPREDVHTEFYARLI